MPAGFVERFFSTSNQSLYSKVNYCGNKPPKMPKKIDAHNDLRRQTVSIE